MLTALGCFVLAQLGLSLTVALWLPQLRDPNHALKADRLKQRMAGPERPLTVVMLGSSRTLYGLQGQSLETPLTRKMGRPVVMFNFGLSGAGPLTELLTLRRLLADGVRPDLLLVEVLPPLLAGQIPFLDAMPQRHPASSLRAQELSLVKRYGGSYQQGLRRAWGKCWLLPCYHHRFALVSSLFPSLLPYNDRLDGYRGINDSGDLPAMYKAAQRPVALAAAAREYETYLHGFRLGGGGPQALEELVQLCRREGVPVALVVMPEGPAFRSWYRGQSWREIQDFLAGLSRRYAVPVVNAHEWLAEDDFVDSHHMLPWGGARFSERLGREAIVPLLRWGIPSTTKLAASPKRQF